MREIEKSLTETLGTRVIIENRPNGGRVLIEFFSPDDLTHLVAALATHQNNPALDELEVASGISVDPLPDGPETFESPTVTADTSEVPNTTPVTDAPITEATSQPPVQEDPDLYSVTNFIV